MLNLKSDSQTQTERVQRPYARLIPRLPVIPTCQGLPFIILKSPARLLPGAVTPWERLSPHRNPANPLTMFKAHSLE